MIVSVLWGHLFDLMTAAYPGAASIFFKISLRDGL